MSIFDVTAKTDAILAFDIFKMLGLESLSDKEKDEYLRRFTQLILEYYFQEKIGDNLTDKQAESLMKKYPATSELNVEAFLEEVGVILPSASDLFMEALTEMKAKIVMSHYTNKQKRYEEMLTKEDDPNRQDALNTMLEEVNTNLRYMEEDKWEVIEWLNQEDMA